MTKPFYVIPTTLLFAFMSIKSPFNLEGSQIDNVAATQRLIFDAFNSMSGLMHGFLAFVISFVYLQASGLINYKTLSFVREMKRYAILDYIVKSQFKSAVVIPGAIALTLIFAALYFILQAQGVGLTEFMRFILGKGEQQ